MDPEGDIQSNWEEVVENFDDMGLKEELLRGIYAYGFEKPSAIQQRAIMPCVKGHDVIAQAQSGTGKTATFSISILQQIDTSIRDCQALILAPTRELAQQVSIFIWKKTSGCSFQSAADLAYYNSANKNISGIVMNHLESLTVLQLKQYQRNWI